MSFVFLVGDVRQLPVQFLKVIFYEEIYCNAGVRVHYDAGVRVQAEVGSFDIFFLLFFIFILFTHNTN
jgi:hypothetical protein